MLENYSWSDYLFTAGILTAGYYFVIGGVYYRHEIKQLLSGKLKFNLIRTKNAGAASDEEEVEVMRELETVAGSIKRSILEQAGANASKDQLLLQLRLCLANYNGLRYPACRVAVNNFIVQHAKEICGVSFSDGELNAAWETLPR